MPRSSPHTLNALLLVETPQQARCVAAELRKTGRTSSQQWVSNHSDFAAALARESFDLGIIYCTAKTIDLPVVIARYPDTPFLALLERYKHRQADLLLEQGAADTVGLGQPVQLARALKRLLDIAELRNENARLKNQCDDQHATLQLVLENNPAATASLSYGLHNYANQAYRTLTGLRDDTRLVETPLLDLIAVDCRDAVAATVRTVERGDLLQSTVSAQLKQHDAPDLSVAITVTASFFDDERAVQLSIKPDDTDNNQQQIIAHRGQHQQDQVLSEKPLLDETLALDATLVTATPAPDTELKWFMHSIENLTPARYRRYLAVLDSEPALDNADTVIQDRWLLEQTTHWLQKRNSDESIAQLFVRLKTPAHRLQNLRRWLHRVVSARSKALQQELVLVTHAEQVATAASLKGIDSIDFSGVSVCIEAGQDKDVF